MPLIEMINDYMMRNTTKNTLYLIYDGDCILCRNTALATKIKKSVGELELINAREAHPLVKEVLDKGYDLNEGIIVKYNDEYFYASDAVNFLALISSNSNTFNRINSFVFRHKWTSRLFYPFLKSIRYLILYVRRIPPLPMPAQAPLIQKIYGEQASSIPNILQMRYSNRPYSTDKLLLKGEMNIKISRTFKILSPLFRLAGALVPYPGEKIPTTVEFVSNEKSNKVLMHRTFYYPGKSPYHFSSQIIHVKNNIIVELMRLGFGTKLIYTIDKNKIIMDYGGYVFRIGKTFIPIPLGFLIGKFYSYEEAVADDQFNMLVKLTHPLFGEIFRYQGWFKCESSFT